MFSLLLAVICLFSHLLPIHALVIPPTPSTEYGCNTTNACSNQTITQGGLIVSGGYRSASGSLTSLKSSNQYISCTGDESCSKAALLNGKEYVYCTGDSSCKDASNITTREFNCIGANSCANSLMDVSRSGTQLYCGGDQSCSGSTILQNKIDTILGFGAYSLLNGVIDSGTSAANSYVIYLTGYYAGYNLSVICRAGDTCSINCRGYGCVGTSIQCIGICKVNCTDTESVYCPDASYGDSVDTLDMPWNVQVLSNAFHSACDTAMTALTVDTRQGGMDSSYVAGNNGVIDSGYDIICCRGWKSCMQSDLTVISKDVDVVCSGSRSCVNTVITLDVVEDNSEDNRVFCDGYLGCENAFINGSSVAYTTNYVHCGGFAGCNSAKIVNTYSVVCSGTWSCNNATMIAVENVYIMGWWEVATGATIDSDDREGQLNVYLNSHNAGRSLSIYCRESDNCTVNCNSNGACNEANMIVYCWGNCTINCDTGAGITCPNTIYYPTSEPTVKPTSEPTNPPTDKPTRKPTSNPTDEGEIVTTLDNGGTGGAVDTTQSSGNGAVETTEDNGGSGGTGGSGVMSTTESGGNGGNTGNTGNNGGSGMSTTENGGNGGNSGVDMSSTSVIIATTEGKNDTSKGAANSEETSKQVESVKEDYVSTLLVFIIIFVVLIIAGYIDGMIIRPNELFNGIRIVLLAMYTLDFVSDCFFVGELLITFDDPSNIGHLVLLLASILSIVVPLFGNIYQLQVAIKQWMSDPDSKQVIRAWMRYYLRFLYLLSFISGSSFSAVELCNSNLFQLSLFSMGLSQRHTAYFKNQRVFTVVLLENIPQFIIQCIWLFWVSSENGSNLVTYFAMVFTVLSVLSSLLEYCLQAYLLDTETLLILKFTVNSQRIQQMSRLEFHKKIEMKRSGLENTISKLLTVDFDMIEELKPIQTKEGALLTFHIAADNMHPHQVAVILENSIMDNYLPSAVKNIYKLETVPLIQNVETKELVAKVDQRQYGRTSIANFVIKSQHNINPSLDKMSSTGTNATNGTTVPMMPYHTATNMHQPALQAVHSMSDVDRNTAMHIAMQNSQSNTPMGPGGTVATNMMAAAPGMLPAPPAKYNNNNNTPGGGVAMPEGGNDGNSSPSGGNGAISYAMPQNGGQTAGGGHHQYGEVVVKSDTMMSQQEGISKGGSIYQ